MRYPINSFIVSTLAYSSVCLANDRQIVVSSRGPLIRTNSSLPIWPTPQESSVTSNAVRLNGSVTIVTGNLSDSATLDLIEQIVTSAGGSAEITPSSVGYGTQLIIGTTEDNLLAQEVAVVLTGSAADDLNAEGYVLATGLLQGQPTIVLHGVDTPGTFYAAQSLRQLVDTEGFVPGVKVRDWPLMSVRGSVEGFYGIPWSHEARLDQFKLYGKHKLNTYIYTPKDDKLLRLDWRVLYQGDDLAKLKELIDEANAHHVDFTFALSPGNDLCYSSDTDFNATVTKFEQIRELGVQRFYLALDDIPTDGFHCDSDVEEWPIDDEDVWLANAQTYYLNRLQLEYIEEHGLEDLETVPTHYAGSNPEPYKTAFGTELNKKVRVHWTGEDVFSADVTVESVSKASNTYVTDKLFFWDNFPVNDGDFSRLFLNPLTERDQDLYKHLLGFTSNPMQQPYASMIALINYADYTWNGPVYEATESMNQAMRELAGPSDSVYDSLVAFVDLNQNWPYREPEVFAPKLGADITDFWQARKDSGGAQGRRDQPLRQRLQILATLNESLSHMEMEGFAADIRPWSTAATQWAEATLSLIDMLDALDSGDIDGAFEAREVSKALIEKTKAKTIDTLDRQGNPDSYAPNVGDGLFQRFLSDAEAVFDKKTS